MTMNKMMAAANYYKGKKIIILGGAGSIGSELVHKLTLCAPAVVRVFDSDETGLFDLERRSHTELIRPLVGDIRDLKRLKRAFEDVDVVFHAAALKHVPLCEYNPFEAVQTNVLGTQNVIDAALDEEVEKVVFISTDKAVNPNTVLGATKLLAERLITSANYYKGLRETAFSSVRFGNVLATRGSVVPVFLDQIASGGPVTVTDLEMTRFVMSVPNAVELILKAGEDATGGEIFILKMQSLRIIDLAEAMIEQFASQYGYNADEIEVTYVGKRYKEKLHEDLFTSDEAESIVDKGEFFVLDPTNGMPEKRSSTQCYTSLQADRLSKANIKELFEEKMK